MHKHNADVDSNEPLHTDEAKLMDNFEHIEQMQTMNDRSDCIVWNQMEDY